MMKKLFIFALLFASLGGCSSMSVTSSYSDDSEPPESDSFQAELSSVKYLRSLSARNSIEIQLPAGGSVHSTFSLQQRGVLAWNETSD